MCGNISRRTLLAGAAATATLAAAPSASAVAGPATGYGDARYSVSRYQIGDTILTYPSSPARLYGATTMTCHANASLTKITVDFALTVRSATINGKAAAVRRVDWRTVELSGFAVAAGASFTTVMRYDDTPAARRHALGGVEASGAYLSFVGEPDNSIYWHPANDRLTNRARYEISVSTQRTNQVFCTNPVSRLDFTSSTGVPMRNVRFRIDEPSAPYHPGLHVGPFRSTSGTWSIGTKTVPFHLAAVGAIPTELTTHTPQSLRYFASFYGAYPYSHAGGIQIAGTGLVGAQETIGMPSYGVRSRGGPISDSIATIAHENAHMWFGNAITAATWKDVVLIQEGLATLAGVDYCRRVGQNPNYAPSAPRSGIDWAHYDWGPAALARSAPYNHAAGIWQELRRTMDGTTSASSSSTFTAFLRELVATHAYSGVSRAQLKTMAQKHTTTSLTSFWAAYAI